MNIILPFRSKFCIYRCGDKVQNILLKTKSKVQNHTYIMLLFV